LTYYAAIVCSSLPVLNPVFEISPYLVLPEIGWKRVDS
jgi:hypothetical protein